MPFRFKYSLHAAILFFIVARVRMESTYYYYQYRYWCVWDEFDYTKFGNNCENRRMPYRLLAEKAHEYCTRRTDGFIYLQTFMPQGNVNFTETRYCGIFGDNHPRTRYHLLWITCCRTRPIETYVLGQCNLVQMQLGYKCYNRTSIERQMKPVFIEQYACTVNLAILPPEKSPCSAGEYRMMVVSCCGSAPTSTSRRVTSRTTSTTRRVTSRTTSTTRRVTSRTTSSTRRKMPRTSPTRRLITRRTTSTTRRSTSRRSSTSTSLWTPRTLSTISQTTWAISSSTSPGNRPRNAPREAESSTEMSAESVIGMVFGAICFCIIIVLIVVAAVMRQRKNEEPPMRMHPSHSNFNEQILFVDDGALFNAHNDSYSVGRSDFFDDEESVSDASSFRSNNRSTASQLALANIRRRGHNSVEEITVGAIVAPRESTDSLTYSDRRSSAYRPRKSRNHDNYSDGRESLSTVRRKRRSRRRNRDDY